VNTVVIDRISIKGVAFTSEVTNLWQDINVHYILLLFLGPLAQSCKLKIIASNIQMVAMALYSVIIIVFIIWSGICGLRKDEVQGQMDFPSLA